MSLKEQLMEDFKVAMRNKEKLKKDVLMMARAAVKQKEVDTRTELSDADVIDIIAKQIKQKKDSIEDFKKANRDDLVEQAESEIKLLEPYMPEQLSEEEVEAIVKEAIEATGAESMRDMGKVMGAVMPKVKGRADGTIVNQMVKKHLN
ncbi:MAG: GatB/YqeY domain-containing protein [Tissierellales bacterium]|jgi:uncharacterized protein YqeY|nr:GatB/YqeY domain-containing protein [Tissierellales bacterium]